MSLLNLLYQFVDSPQLIGVAHCNFSLRGGESDMEQQLVERRCKELGVRCHTIRFETKKECAITGESTQMAARRLRYEWFDSLCEEFGYSRIAIAHHNDDAIETFFINLLRGSGLRGLTGINISRERIIRPLLFASRLSIERYALENSLEYLTDSSNLNTEYLRNRMRHDILPRFHSSSSVFGRTMGANIERLSAAQRFIDAAILKIKEAVVRDGKINLEELDNYGEREFLLFEILREYGFSGEVVDDIVRASHTGKQFYSDTHVITLDRGYLLLNLREHQEFEERLIEQNGSEVEWMDVSRLMSLECPSNVALLSADALQFPLRLRKWESGDWFIPLGMRNPKKVSDFLIDSKVPLPQKANQGVLMSGDAIVWVVGRRIDERYKVTEGALQVVRITL